MSEATPVAVETPPCPLCGSTEGGIVVGARGRFGMAVQNIACERCALVYQSPRPTHAAMMEYYAGEYRRQYAEVRFPTATGPVGPGEPGYEEALEGWHLGQATCSMRLGATRIGQRVLEIGCRHGRTLSIMRDRLGILPYGIEPGPEEARLAEANGIQCFNGTLEAFDPGETRFDQIQLFHVFEHLHEPLGALVRMRALLAPGGKIVVEVPNVHQPYGLLEENFFQNAHITNFSAETLPAMFRRAGLDVSIVIDEEVLYIVGASDGSTEPLPRSFDPEMLAAPRRPAQWVADRLATYAELEKLRTGLLARGPSMELINALVKALGRPAFVPHTISVVSEAVEFFIERGAPRAAAIIANAAAMGPHEEEVVVGFRELAAAVAGIVEPAEQSAPAPAGAVR
jgi:SAM-dependent methyltransferase